LKSADGLDVVKSTMDNEHRADAIKKLT